MTSMREICRLCMCRDDHMMSIFDEEAIAVKITWVSQLKINEGDQLPCQICNQCSLRLNSAYYFKEQCISIDKALREMIQHQSSATFLEAVTVACSKQLRIAHVESVQGGTEGHSPSAKDVKQEVSNLIASEVNYEDGELNTTIDKFSSTTSEQENDIVPLSKTVQAVRDGSTAKASNKRKTRLRPSTSSPLTMKEKLFSCQICNKRFEKNAGLKVHLHVHSKKDKQKNNLEKLTQPRSKNDLHNCPDNAVATIPNICEEVDIKQEPLNIPAEVSVSCGMNVELQTTRLPPDFNELASEFLMETNRPPHFRGHNVEIPMGNLQSSGVNRSAAGFSMVTTKSPQFNRSGADFPARWPSFNRPNAAGSYFNVHNDGIRPTMHRAQSSNFSGTGVDIPSSKEADQFCNASRSSVIMPTEIARSRDFNRPDISNPMQATQMSSINSTPMERHQSPFSNRPVMRNPMQAAQHSAVNRSNIGSNPMQATQISSINSTPMERHQSTVSNRPDMRNPMQAVQYSAVNRSNIGSNPMQATQISSINSTPMERHQSTVSNRPDMRNPMQAVQYSAVNRSNIGSNPMQAIQISSINSIPMERHQSTISNRPDMRNPMQAVQYSAVNRSNIGTSNPIEMPQPPVFNRPDIRIPMQAAHYSGVNRSNTGSTPMEEFQSSNLNNSHVGNLMEAAQFSALNQNIDSITMERLKYSGFNSPPNIRTSNETRQYSALNRSSIDQPSDFNNPGLGMVMEMDQYFGLNKSNSSIPQETAQSSDYSRPRPLASTSAEAVQRFDHERPSIGISKEVSRHKGVSRRSVGDMPMEMVQHSGFDSSVNTVPIKTARHSDFTRPNPGNSFSTDAPQSPGLSRSSFDIPMEEAQYSVCNTIGVELSTAISSPNVNTSAPCKADELITLSPSDLSSPKSDPKARITRQGKVKRRLRNRTKNLVYKCPFCVETFKAKKKAEKHILGHLQSETDDGPPLQLDEFEPISLDPVPTEPDTFTCSACTKTFWNKAALLSHIRAHSKKNLSCGRCDETFQTESSFSTHMMNHSGFLYLDKDHYPCHMCSKKYGTLQNLNRHIRTHHGTEEKPFGCVLCHSWFADQKKLGFHLKDEHGKELYCCRICQDSFASVVEFREHLEVHPNT